MNYLPHETIVKYGDGLFAQSQEWQWFINEVEKEYRIEDIHSWNEYLTGSQIQIIILKYFSKILEVCGKEWQFSKPGLEEIWNIAKFYNGDIGDDDCVGKIQSDPGKLFFLCTWITKIENGDNGSSYYYDGRLLCQGNYFELIRCDALLKHEQKILDYAKTIHIDCMDKPIECFRQNLHHYEVQADESFLTEHESYFLNFDTFSYHGLHRLNVVCETWQEFCLLRVTEKTLSREETRPESNQDALEPDPSLWTEENLKKVKEYFDHEISDFVIDTVLYVEYGVEPSKKIKDLHCRLLLDALNDPDIENDKIINSSSFFVLSCLFQDGLMKGYHHDQDYTQLIDTLQGWKVPSEIAALKKGGFPVLKEQNHVLTEYNKNRHREIDNVSSFEELYVYLNNDMTPKGITSDYLRKVYDKFETYAVKGNNRLTPGAFYSFMVFLIRAKGEGSGLDKHDVEKLMLQVQKTWQDSTYEAQLKDMQPVSQKLEIKEDQVDSFSRQWLHNPVLFACSCIPCSEEAILGIMENVSKYPYLCDCSHIILDPVFPVRDNDFSLEKKDTMLFNFVDSIRQDRGYRLHNQMESGAFVWAVHCAIKNNTQFAASLFTKEEELYNTVRDPFTELLPYSDEITAAYVTQLFPLLELKIQKLAESFGIFPFKEETKDGIMMQHKDPSSLLCELLNLVYSKQKSLEKVPDLLFIYHIMYDRNSCNVRNSFIHGRDYLNHSGLRFAFRTTLFAIHMVDFRLETIKENTCDLMN